jgi:hypothetical protein
MGGACRTHVGDEKSVQNFGWKREVKTLLGRPRMGWEDSIRMGLMVIGLEIVDWIDLGQDKDQLWDFVNTAMNFRIP